MSTQAILERERRYRRWVVAASILPLLLFFAGTAVQGGVVGPPGLLTERLRSIDAETSSYLISSILLAGSFLLLALPLAYLFAAARARNERVIRGLLFLTLLGPIVLFAQLLLFTLGEIEVAREFAGQEQEVGDIYSLAVNLSDDSSLENVARGLQAIGGLSFIFGMIYVPLWAVRTGLLTRFHGTLGMALGASIILPGVSSIALPALLAWFMYFGLVLAGKTPRGRPPAWDAGVAVPPPKPGEEAAAPSAAAVESGPADATGIPGVEENPNAARRERARKRKRKQRR